MESLKNFPTQFEFEPKIENYNNLKHAEKIIVIGMGGSHLAAGLLQSALPELDLIIHKNYGLPKLSQEILAKSLIIASSYSGNTEEVIDAFKDALGKKLNLAVISVGGELLNLAKENNIPYVQMPDTGIQPRMALGLNLMALAKLINRDDLINEFKDLKDYLNGLSVDEMNEKGKELAEKIKNKIPVIYSSAENSALSCNWKIKFNESAKIPAFYNVFSELNHNEMAGFSRTQKTSSLSDGFCFIFLKDPSDHPRIIKRMAVCQKLFESYGFEVELIELKGESFWQKAFSNLLLADWTVYNLADIYDVEFERVPIVEEFKKLINE
ncbi:MAG: bifunctional phosphoglucose/phosphomannose isomerase [Patescibacteria group bacterium]